MMNDDDEDDEDDDDRQLLLTHNCPLIVGLAVKVMVLSSLPRQYYKYFPSYFKSTIFIWVLLTLPVKYVAEWQLESTDSLRGSARNFCRHRQPQRLDKLYLSW